MVRTERLDAVIFSSEAFPELMEAGNILLRALFRAAQKIAEEKNLDMRMLYNELLLSTISAMILESNATWNAMILKAAIGENHGQNR